MLCRLDTMAALIKAPRIDASGIRLPHACPQVPEAGEHVPVIQAPAPVHHDGRQFALDPSCIDEENERRIAELQASLNRELAEIATLRETRREEGYVAGYQNGIEAGRQAACSAADKKVDERLVIIDEMLQQLRSTFDGVLANAESIIAAIVFEAVCKIVGRELASVEGATAAIRQIIERVGADACVTIRLAPSDFAWLQGKGLHAGALPASLAQVIAEDPNVVLGGCLVTVANGEIDGRIETQFRNFAQGLKDAIRQR